MIVVSNSCVSFAILRAKGLLCRKRCPRARFPMQSQYWIMPLRKSTTETCKISSMTYFRYIIYYQTLAFKVPLLDPFLTRYRTNQGQVNQRNLWRPDRQLARQSDHTSIKLNHWFRQYCSLQLLSSQETVRESFRLNSSNMQADHACSIHPGWWGSFS